MKIQHILILVVSAFILGIVAHKSFSSDSHTIGLWWNEYIAYESGKVINISESEDSNSAPFRMVHINQAGSGGLVGITGHDYNMDGTWDRIFWTGYDKQHIGANSYVLTKSGWQYDSCPGEKDLPAIPEKEIAPALAALNGAMKYRTLDNITILWTKGSMTNFFKKSS